jgi:hypothetical protein
MTQWLRYRARIYCEVCGCAIAIAWTYYCVLYLQQWHQLTKLVIWGITNIEMLDMLRCSPNLMEFYIAKQDFPDIYPPPDISVVTLNQLQTLNIQYPSQPHDIFEHLALPALHNLTTHTIQWPHAEFITFLSRSLCSLTRLQIHNTVSSAAQLIETLDNAPCWWRWILSTIIFEKDDDFTKRLIYDPDSDHQTPCLLRKLEVLTFGYELFYKMSLVGDLIMSRWCPDTDSNSEGSDGECDDKSTSSGLELSCLRNLKSSCMFRST